MPAEKATCLQFGEFTLDLRQRQLRRGTELLPLSGKAYDLLVYLTTNPGRAIEKTELLQAVWPNSYVEEGNLTQNIFLLRKMLGTGPGSPISTVAGHGYLFAAPVTELFPASGSASFPQTLETTRTRVVMEEETEVHVSAWRSPLVLSLTGAGLILLGLVGWFGWQRWEDRTGGPPVQAVLTDFTSNTGDAVLDHTLEDALRIDLAQSPFVTVVSSATTRRTLVEMTHKPDEVLTPALGHEICERTGSQVTLEGELARTGNHYLATAQAINCVDGSTVAAAQREVSSASELPTAMGKIAAILRHQLGESRRSIARFSTTLSPTVTPSLEALEDYSQASRLGQQAKYPEATSMLKQAVALDPNFASAYMDLSIYAADMGDFQAQRPYLEKAYELRDHATEPARRLILAQYDAYITGDLHQSVRDIEAWTEMYPRSAQAFAGLGEVYRELDLHAEAIGALQHAVVLSPHSSALYYGLASEQLAAGDVSAAKATADLAVQRGYDSDTLRMVLCRIAVVKNDEALLQQQREWASAHPGSIYTTLTLAHILQNEKEFKAARDLLESDIRVLATIGQSSLAPAFEQELALSYLWLGDVADAHALANTDLYDEHSPMTALLLAGFGDETRASADLARHLHDAPRGTLWNELHAPSIRARIMLQQKRPQDALNALVPAAEFLDRDLELRLTRAEIYRALNRLSEAEADFRFILNHRFLDPVSYAVPVANSELTTLLQHEGKSNQLLQ